MVFPTVAIILWAYGLYAFCTAWPRRQARAVRGRSRGRRGARLALAGGIAVVLGALIWVSLHSSQPDRNLNLAGFLGLGWRDGGAAEPDRRMEPMPVKGQKAGEHPGYAYLHPGAPSGQVAPEKKVAAPKPLPKPKARSAPKAQAKGGKVGAIALKKEKAAGKTQPKKKKPQTPPTSRATGG